MLRRLRGLFARREEPFPDLADVTLRPIGYVRSPVKQTRPDGWRDVVSRVVVRPELADALLNLGDYSHVVIVFWPHKVPEDVRGSKHQLHPRDDPQNPLMGILATRSQIRFNPILVSAVKLLSVKGNVLKVRGLDAIDGTPVLDVKPYLPHYDGIPDARVPKWVSDAQARHRPRP